MIFFNIAIFNAGNRSVLMSKIIARECRFVFHKPADSGNKDTHIVKEMLHYSNGTTNKSIRLIEDFRRPFWVTKMHKRNHKDKKESELIDNLLEGTCTQSNMGREIAVKLGSRYNGVTSLWDIKSSPFVYGIDINSKTYIKHLYQTKYPDIITPYEVCVLDIETDTITNEIIIMSISTKDKLYTVITKKFLQAKITSKDKLKDIEKEVIPKLEYLYNKYVPETDISKNIHREYCIVNTELDVVLEIMTMAHKWKPDFMAVWNMGYDVPKLLEVLKKYHVDPKGVFCEPTLPDNVKYFKYKEGPRQKVTASGKFKPIEPKDRWDVVDCPASFYWIDAMASYNYIRIGGKTIPGGYSLDNVLKYELGSKLSKLKFEDDTASYIKGIDWHQHMVANKPLEYVIYNQWDVMSVLQLDDKTMDLNQVLPMLSGISNFDIFNSGPKRIVDALHFYYLEHGRVLSCRDPKAEDKDLLGLGSWITLLPSHRISDKGASVICGSNINSNIRQFVSDSDQVSGYPSNTQAANVSIDTTVKEIKSIGDIPLSEFRLNNINLLFGKVNAIQYAVNMLNMPTINEIMDELEKK